MLVYCKNPMGYMTISGKRVYGKKFNYGRFGPTDITWKDFLKNKNRLEDVTVTPKMLKKTHGVDFDTPFRLTKLANLPYDKVVELALLLGIDFKMPYGRKKANKEEVYWLRRYIVNILTE